MQPKILIIDDEADIRSAIRGILEDESYVVEEAGQADVALALVPVFSPDLIILDVWLKTGERDGLELLSKLRKRHPSVPVVMISGHGNIEMAVGAIKQGAYDFIEKPFQAERMLLTLSRVIEATRLRVENKTLKEQVAGVADLIGSSQQIQHVRSAIEKVAPTNSRVFISGAAGTGKEVVARMIHRASTRATGPYVAVNCATISLDQFDHDLFGSEHHPGLLHQANGGTLYLDEICDVTPVNQARILRVLQEKKYQHPVTGVWIDIDVRVISSASRSMTDMVKAGTFREDLFYRLNVVTIELPSIADRRDDIPAFINHFMKQSASVSGKPLRALTPSALAVLQLFPWPGNVRQLKNVAEWMVIMGNGGADVPIDVDGLPPEITRPVMGGNGGDTGVVVAPELMTLPLREAREMFERAYLQAQIGRFGGSVSKAAHFVGMERSALHRKLKSLFDDGINEDVPANESSRDVA